MAAADYNNDTGWRHQHSGVRLQYETLIDICSPDWRNTLILGVESWAGCKKHFVKQACEEMNLFCPESIREIGSKTKHCEDEGDSNKIETMPLSILRSNAMHHRCVRPDLDRSLHEDR
eukprot:2144588-Karenia_brevis.AAC.1